MLAEPECLGDLAPAVAKSGEPLYVCPNVGWNDELRSSTSSSLGTDSALEDAKRLRAKGWYRDQLAFL
jgi:hypothetical protein